MKEWLVLATNVAVDAINWLALVLIVVGAVEAFFRGLWTMLSSPDGHHERDAWLRLGRWLVAGLTFQLAACPGNRDHHELGRGRTPGGNRRDPHVSIISSSVTWARSERGRERPKARSTDRKISGAGARKLPSVVLPSDGTTLERQP